MKIFKFLICFVCCLCSYTSFALTNVNLYFEDLDDEFFYRDSADQFHALTKSFEVSLKEFNAQRNTQLQFKQIDQSFTLEEQAIVFSTDPKLQEFALERAKENESQIVFFNVQPKEKLLKKYENAWYVGTDPIESARKQVKMVSDYLFLNKETADKNHNGKIDIVILRGMKNDPQALTRSRLAWEYLTTLGFELNPLSASSDNWNYTEAYNDMKKVLEKHSTDDIELIVSNNDAMALGAIQALNEIGFNLPYGQKDKLIPVFGIDGTKDGMKAVVEQKMAGTVYVDKTALARASLILAMNPYVTEKEASELIRQKVINHTVLFPFVSFANFKDYGTKE